MTTEPAAEGLGPLERKHLQYASFRAVAGGAEVTRTHWHIAVTNGLGWGFDGMDSMVFSLVAPLVITEFALDLQQSTGSFALAFLFIPALMIAMAAGVWLSVPEHAGKELYAIIM